MSVAWSPCVHTARTAMPGDSGRSGRFASFRRAGLRFRTIADMMPLSWYNGKSTANAVGCNHPPGFKSPILRFLSSSFAPGFHSGGLLLSASPDPCAHNARTRPLSGLIFISPCTRLARASVMPGFRSGSP